MGCKYANTLMPLTPAAGLSRVLACHLWRGLQICKIMHILCMSSQGSSQGTALPHRTTWVLKRMPPLCTMPPRLLCLGRTYHPFEKSFLNTPLSREALTAPLCALNKIRHQLPDTYGLSTPSTRFQNAWRARARSDSGLVAQAHRPGFTCRHYLVSMDWIDAGHEKYECPPRNYIQR